MNFGAPLGPVKVKGGKWLLPVKIITNNTLETIVFRNTDLNNDSLMPFKSK